MSAVALQKGEVQLQLGSSAFPHQQAAADMGRCCPSAAQRPACQASCATRSGQLLALVGTGHTV